MQARSVEESGKLSGSLAAAASTCFGVIARIRRLFIFDEIVILFMPRSASRRDNSEPAVSLGVNNRNDSLLRGTDQDETLFAVVLAIIQPFDTKGIPEDLIAVSKLTPCLT